MTKKLFTSDLHAHHKRICDFTNRGLFTDFEHHNEWLIDIWNRQVARGDFVYILGDVSFATKALDIAEFLEQLNGQKFIIKGNHDRSENLKTLVDRNVITGWDHYKEIKVKDIKTCMMHFPIASWNQQGRGSFMVHGHSHGSYQGEGRILDVGIDSAYNKLGSHRLFTEDDIYDILMQKEIYSPDHCKIVKE